MYVSASRQIWRQYKHLDMQFRGFETFTNLAIQGLYSSGKTPYRQMLSLQAAKFDDMMVASLWKFTRISAALLPRCLSNFIAIGKVWTQISCLRGMGTIQPRQTISGIPSNIVYLRFRDWWIIVSITGWGNDVSPSIKAPKITWTNADLL